MSPAFVDLHCDLAWPGHLHREGLASGTAAAARGGFGAVCPSPATEPPLDQPEAIAALVAQGGAARLWPVAALTVGAAGRRLTEAFALRDAGAVALGDGGAALADTGLLRRALEYARAAGLPVFLQPEDASLAGVGVMHEGPVSTALGLPGVPAAAELIAVDRALALAELTGARIHLGPISAAGSVERLERARSRGIAVTAAVAAAHLHLVDAAIADRYDTALRVRPPLRAEADRAALRRGLAAGIIDAVTSAHTPHSPAEKADTFAGAPPGMIGLETTLGATLSLVAEGAISLVEAVARLCCGPASVLGRPAALRAGAPADVVVFDPEARVRIDASSLRSRARNTPFMGRALPGRVRLTLVGGQVVYDAEEDAC